MDEYLNDRSFCLSTRLRKDSDISLALESSGDTVVLGVEM
jgi:hypothetical protein